MLQLGLAEKARGELDAASEWLERACAADPASAVARFYSARCSTTAGSTTRRSRALREAIARNPDYAEAHYLLAFVYGDMGQHEAAREATKRAIALNPTLARAQANLALERFDRERAARSVRRAAAPRRPAPHRRPQPRRRARPWRTSTSASRSGRRATTTRRCASTGSRSRPARTGGSTSRRWPRCTCSAASWAPRSSCTTGWSATIPTRPSSGTSAASASTRPGGGPRRSTPTSARSAIDSAYQLAWNNLGVVRAHEAKPTPRSRPSARRSAPTGRSSPRGSTSGCSRSSGGSSAPRSRSTSRRCAEQPASAVAWNGVGLVLMELRRYEDARNAFGRAVDADAGFAAAHYNLSFVLSQLGDFDGALRETRRALELEPLYVPQKFALTIDLQYEDPTIAIAPELAAEAGGDELAGEFAFDAPALDRLFDELTPGAPAGRRRRAGRRARPGAGLHRQGTARPRAGGS